MEGTTSSGKRKREKSSSSSTGGGGGGRGKGSAGGGAAARRAGAGGGAAARHAGGGAAGGGVSLPRQLTLDECFRRRRSRKSDSSAGGGGGRGGVRHGAPSSTAGSTKQVARKRTSQAPLRPPAPPRGRQNEDEEDDEDTTTRTGVVPSPGPSSGSRRGRGGGEQGGAEAVVVGGGGAESNPPPEQLEVIELRVRRGRPHPQIEYQYTMVELGVILAKSEKDTVEFGQKHGLLLNERPCKECMQTTTLEYRSQGNPRWVCRRHAPSFVETITKKTVFEGSHMRMDKLLILFYMFSHGITEYRHLQREISSRPAPPPPPEGGEKDDEDEEAEDGHVAARREAARRAAANKSRAQWIKASSATIRQWLLFAREICFVFLDTQFEAEGRIGGVGVVVEVDECKIGAMKYHVGRRVDGHWILGMIEINTGEEGEKRRGGRFRLELCPENRRDETTLRELIQKHVLPGTTLVTDGWKAYCRISEYNYDHFTVIHEYNFVDPGTGANTQTIESNWRAVKRKLLRGGLKRGELALHLCEFLWRRYVYGLERDPFIEFLSAAAFAYDPARVLTDDPA